VNRLRQFWNYVTKVFTLPSLLAAIGDERPQAIIPTRSLAVSLFLAAVLRIGSLLQLEKETTRKGWQRLTRWPHRISDDAFGYALERDGYSQDISVPVTFNARIGRGRPVIPVGVTLRFLADRSLEFAALLDKPGTHEQVWAIGIDSGTITNTLRSHRKLSDPDFATFDGVPTPAYLRKYLKDLRHFGRAGLAPAFLMHVGVLKNQPEYADCTAGVSPDGRHVLYKARKGPLSNFFVYGDLESKKVLRWATPPALQHDDSMEFVWVETP
jgi:hypothetical protein